MLTLVLLIFLLIGIFVVIILLLTNRKQAIDTSLIEWVKTTQHDIRNLQQIVTESSARSSQEMSQTLNKQTQDIHERLSHASDIISDLKREAGAFSEVSRSMKDLHDFLRSPKLRGNIGERVLNDIISQMFPKQSFFIQHRFKSGNIVDIAIQTDVGLLPIDSKFPLEHFQLMMKEETEVLRAQAQRSFVKDVKKHIDDIANKYILPEEGTMDFALMYIPSESVYYEIATDDSLLEYAQAKRVYPVSPTTLYAHLQTILLSFEGKKIESKTRELFKLLRSIDRDYGKVNEQFQTLGRHLGNAQNMYTTLHTSLTLMGSTLHSSKELISTEETNTILLPSEKPSPLLK